MNLIPSGKDSFRMRTLCIFLLATTLLVLAGCSGTNGGTGGGSAGGYVHIGRNGGSLPGDCDCRK